MKFVKKTVAVLALSALLAGCTVVPPAADPTVPPKPSVGPTQPQAPAQPTDPSQSPAADQNMSLLSAARMGEIADAWYLTTSAPLGAWCTDEDEGFTDGVRYYGSYGGYDILFRPNGDDAITTLEVEDVTFEHRTGFEIYAYRDGSFTPIKELASQGKLTGGTLAELLSLHRSYEGRSTGDRGPVLTADTLELMKAAFLKANKLTEKYTTADLSVVYYGQYGEAHVGFINCDGMVYTQALTSDNIDGVIFRYNSGQKLQVVCGGQLLSLKQAYEQGQLTREDLIAIRNDLNPQGNENLVDK